MDEQSQLRSLPRVLSNSRIVREYWCKILRLSVCYKKKISIVHYFVAFIIGSICWCRHTIFRKICDQSKANNQSFHSTIIILSI